MVKWNNKHNTFMAITKASGKQTTSLQEFADEFVSKFERLLGTKVDFRLHALG